VICPRIHQGQIAAFRDQVIGLFAKKLIVPWLLSIERKRKQEQGCDCPHDFHDARLYQWLWHLPSTRYTQAMKDDPFTSFQLIISRTEDGTATYLARSDVDGSTFTLGPVAAIESAEVAEKLLGLAQRGFEHKLEILRHVGGDIPVQAKVSCSKQDLVDIGFTPSHI